MLLKQDIITVANDRVYTQYKPNDVFVANNWTNLQNMGLAQGSGCLNDVFCI